jgi:acyl-CoA hydrolase/GNAT superfamily N-acetyltransferase
MSLPEELQALYESKLHTPEEAVRVIKRGDTVFIGTACGEPQALVRALTSSSDILSDNEIIQTLSLGLTPYTDERFTDQMRLNAFFIGPNVRSAVNEGRADYTPIYLSEIEDLFEDGSITVEVALIQVSPPDEAGDCSLGVSVDITKSAAMHANVVIAQVNPRMPRTSGDSVLNIAEFDHIVEVDEELLTFTPEREENPETLSRIGKHLSELVPDGATLQIGYGTTPNAVLPFLRNKKDLGIHTETFSDTLVDLVEAGIINGRRKTLHNGKVVASFVMGSRRLYDFLDGNETVELYPSSYTNDPTVIGRNDNMVAINSALEIDLTGQVCAEQLGSRFHSGIGGQVDFMRGAAFSKGGKPIIALPSTAKDGGVSRIVPTLEEGAGVTTPRGDVHYVVTEYGIAELHGKSIMQRALALISVAHPRFREGLLARAKAMRYIYQDQLEAAFKGTQYPEQYEALVDHKGLSVYYRPAKPTDEPMLRDLFYSFSEDTIYQRYMGTIKSMPHREVQKLADIDYDERMTILALVKVKDKFKAVGVATYDLDRKHNSAEAAFMVSDKYQGRGIGSQMMELLIKVARDKGIKAFTAELLSENFRMLDIFYRTGLKTETRLVEDTYLVRMDLWPKVQ